MRKNTEKRKKTLAKKCVAILNITTATALKATTIAHKYAQLPHSSAVRNQKCRQKPKDAGAKGTIICVYVCMCACALIQTLELAKEVLREFATLARLHVAESWSLVVVADDGRKFVENNAEVY